MAEPMPASARSDRKSVDRAFVIQLAPDCRPGVDGLAGRVQHIASCDGGNFDSVEGLLAFLHRVLERPTD